MNANKKYSFKWTLKTTANKTYMCNECKQKILFQMAIENNSEFSSPKIKIKKGYHFKITMRTLVHPLAHHIHSVSKLNLSFCSTGPVFSQPATFPASGQDPGPSVHEVPDVVGHWKSALSILLVGVITLQFSCSLYQQRV